MAVVESGEAQRLQRDALRLNGEAQGHLERMRVARTAFRREKRRMHLKEEKRDELIAECARLGIKVTFTQTTHPEGGASDDSQDSTRRD